MKKIILIIAAIFTINLLKSQNPDFGWYVDGSNDTLNHRDFESQYLLPEPFLNNCVSLEVFSYFHTGITFFPDAINRNTVSISQATGNLFDYSQPYHSDTIIKIVGISFYGYASRRRCFNFPNACLTDTDILLVITDTLFENRYIQTPVSLPLSSILAIDSNYVGEIPRYTEIIFPEPILIQGSFNLVVNITDDTYKDGVTIFGVKEECPTTQPLPRQKRHNQNSWQEIAYEYYPNKNVQALFLFPILGTIEESDTSSSSLNEIYGLNDFVTISPNPANKQTTIESKYKIKTIEIYNSIGQLTETKQVNNYSYSIDVSKYNSGHYIIKTITTNGTVNKKLIVK